MTLQNVRLFGIIFTIGLLLLVPLVAMRFTTEVNWTLGDFLIAGLLLLSTGFACELALRSFKKVQYRIAACAAILAAFVLVWGELATGYFNRMLTGH